MKLTRHLIIPDAHVESGTSNERFTLLGHLIVENLPDKIICLGDFADMPSLSFFDIGKKSFEGRRYIKDVEATIDAQDKLFKPIAEYNNKYRRAKKEKLYKPQLEMLYGNHEFRILRAVESDAKLEGTMGYEDLCYEDYGWNTTPFKIPLHLDGITYQHYFTKGLMDKAISSVNLGREILKTNHSSGFQGHTHVLSTHNESNLDGKKLYAGSLGCYFDHEVHYVSKKAQNDWWRGITILDIDTETGSIVRHEHITLEFIQNLFR